MLAIIAALFLAGAPPALAQSGDAAKGEIRAALAKWMMDFNSGNTEAICDLFAADLVYDFRGAPERRFHDICDLLRRSLSDRSRRYTYSLDIKEILLSGELAVVRLNWTLRVKRDGTAVETATQEPGMDIFRKDPDGRWKIIRYIAYEAP